MTAAVPAGVAAGHPSTVGAGMEILAAGGNAIDAAVAATLGACAAETPVCGLGGGGFATVFLAATGQVHCLDFFCAVPGREGGKAGAMVPVDIRFGAVPIPYAIGGASVGVPGTPAGCRELNHRFGRLPWSAVVAPAARLAAEGVPIMEALIRPLESIAAAMLRSDGLPAFAPLGRLVRGGERVFHPGLADTLSRLAEGEPFYKGRIARLLVDSVRAEGGALDHTDLLAYRVLDVPVADARIAGRMISGRRDLNNVVRTLRALPPSLAGLPRPERAIAVARTLSRYAHRPGPAPEGPGETTNVSVVDSDGNACVITHTLGLGSGVWLPGMGVHLNSMLGEGELMTPDMRPGDRIGSMMCPLVVVGAGERVELAIGSAGASRIRSALLTTLVGVLVDGLDVANAVAAPRWHLAADIAHLEPEVTDAEADALAGAGFTVHRWPESNHYFGAVSAVGRTGAAGDARRGGAAMTLI